MTAKLTKPFIVEDPTVAFIYRLIMSRVPPTTIESILDGLDDGRKEGDLSVKGYELEIPALGAYAVEVRRRLDRLRKGKPDQ